MSIVRIYSEANSDNFTEYRGAEAQEILSVKGINLERWETGDPLEDNATDEAILGAYNQEIERLKTERNMASADVISITPTKENHADMRKKFNKEHIHRDDEIRFFVEGTGLFYINAGEQIVSILCEAGDLLNVPAGTKHWFDMGAEPFFKCIRLFTDPEGWDAQYTNDPIAERFPSYDVMVGKA